MSSCYLVTKIKNHNFLPLTLIWSQSRKGAKKVLLNQLASVGYTDITLLLKTLCVKKLYFEDIDFFPLQSYDPVLAVELLLCLHRCQRFTINGSIQMSVGGLKREDGNRQHVVSKTKPNTVQQKPKPNQNRSFHGESGVFEPQLLCLV